MGKEHILGQTEILIQATGWAIKWMVLVNLFTPEEMFIKEHGKITK